MEANKILQADVLDILFENRNKEYGAYELRRQYNKRMITALLATLAALILIFAVSFLAGQLEDTSTAAIEIRDVELVNIVEEEQKPEPPPPPPPKQEPPPKVEMTKFTPPKIVRDEEVKKEDIPPEVAKLEATKIDVVSQEGIKDMGIATPVIDEGKAVVVAPVDNTNYDQTFTKVEVEAKFQGGEAAWRNYLTRNLNASAPIDNGANPGQYTVVVQFIVDKEGNISEVSSLTKHGYGMEDEAMRVIRRGPKWEPAIQNGRKVKAYRKQPITFVVTEG
ncbi:MAG: energy transducer TonB [Bacteroidota bacterium]|nr:energy transducer TonB [Bacteroidota bacterium]